jgi:hypothetical protein
MDLFPFLHHGSVRHLPPSMRYLCCYRHTVTPVAVSVFLVFSLSIFHHVHASLSRSNSTLPQRAVPCTSTIQYSTQSTLAVLCMVVSDRNVRFNQGVPSWRDPRRALLRQSAEDLSALRPDQLRPWFAPLTVPLHSQKSALSHGADLVAFCYIKSGRANWAVDNAAPVHATTFCF